MSRFKEGMSPNYDNSFPRQNKKETLDDTRTKEGGIELSRGFSLDETEWRKASAKDILESIEKSLDKLLKNP